MDTVSPSGSGSSRDRKREREHRGDTKGSHNGGANTSGSDDDGDDDRQRDVNGGLKATGRNGSPIRDENGATNDLVGEYDDTLPNLMTDSEAESEDVDQTRRFTSGGVSEDDEDSSDEDYVPLPPDVLAMQYRALGYGEFEGSSEATTEDDDNDDDDDDVWSFHSDSSIRSGEDEEGLETGNQAHNNTLDVTIDKFAERGQIVPHYPPAFNETTFLRSPTPRIHRVKSSIHHFQAADAIACHTNRLGIEEIAVICGKSLVLYEFRSSISSNESELPEISGHAKERNVHRVPEKTTPVQLYVSDLKLDDAYTLSWSPDGACIVAAGTEGKISFFVVERKDDNAMVPDNHVRPSMMRKRSDHVEHPSGRICRRSSISSSICDLRWLGLIDVHEINPVPPHTYIFNEDSMCNSVRFSESFVGEKCCIVADQRGLIFIFRQPDSSFYTISGVQFDVYQYDYVQNVSIVSASGFTRTGKDLKNYTINGVSKAFTKLEHLGRYENAKSYVTLSSSEQMVAGQITIDALCLQCPLNFAAASPNGKFIAACGDSPNVFVLSVESGFNEMKCFRFPHSRLQRSDSCQYLSWNVDSTLIAASSDSLGAVAVWEPASGQIVANFHTHTKPCLPISFHPKEAGMLVYAEQQQRLHITDVRDARKHQVLSVNRPSPIVPNPALIELAQGNAMLENQLVMELAQHSLSIPRTHGLKVTDRHIFWKLREQILVFDVLSEWSTEDHKLFPESFKAAVREILKGAFSKNNNKKDANLANLSADVLHKIFERAAFPVGAWQ